MSSIDLSMTSDREGITETGRTVPVGTRVEYKGHVIGGNVRVLLPDSSVEVMHPHCFAMLRPHRISNPVTPSANGRGPDLCSHCGLAVGDPIHLK